MQVLTSFQNETTRLFKSLTSAQGRRQSGQYLIEGHRLLHEAMLACAPITVLAVREDRQEQSRELIRYARLIGAQVVLVPEKIMPRLCDAKSPQGVAAAVMLPRQGEVDGARILALDHVSDPGNLGTILRTAQAFGCKCVLLSEGCTDPFSPKCVRSGMGAHFKLSFVHTDSLPQILHELKINRGYSVVGGHLNGYESLPPLSDRRVCVVGNEAHGMDEWTARECTTLFRIPMPGGAESLNAGVAAGILMYKLFV